LVAPAQPERDPDGLSKLRPYTGTTCGSEVRVLQLHRHG